MNMRLIASLALALLFVNAPAQIIPNGGFEDWDSTYYPIMPQNWETLTINTPCWPGNVQVIPSLDSYSGCCSALIRNTFCIDDLGNLRLEPGFAYSSHRNMPLPLNTAFSLGARPDSLSFHYKFQREGGDSAYVRIFLFNYDSVTPGIPYHERYDTVAFSSGYMHLQAPAWTQFSLAVEYRKPDVPAFGQILFHTSKTLAEHPLGNTYPFQYAYPGTMLSVDDVYLTGGDVGIMETQAKTALRLFPTPATDRLTVLRRWLPGDRWAVRNMAGQVLYVPGVLGGDRLVLDVSALAGGIYVVEVIGAEGWEVGRVVVR